MCHQWRASETRCGVHKLSRDCSEGRRISQRRIRLRPVATIWPCVKVTSSQVLNLPALRPTSMVAKHSWPTQGKLRYDICFPIIPRKNKTWKQGGESKKTSDCMSALTGLGIVQDQLLKNHFCKCVCVEDVSNTSSKDSVAQCIFPNKARAWIKASMAIGRSLLLLEHML